MRSRVLKGWKRLLICSFALCATFLLVASVSGQEWLEDPSYHPSPLLPFPSSAADGISVLPEEELLTPNGPLDSVPSLVFEESSQTVPPEPPLRGITWHMPWTWMPLDAWSNSAELGMNGTSGNAESMSLQAGTRFTRKTDRNMFDLRLTHNRTNAGGIETQNNALLYADFERFIGSSPWTFFLKNGLEYDEFRAFDLRYNINSGFGYTFAKTEQVLLIGRFGSGASREFGGPDDSWVPEVLFGADYEHQLNERHKVIVRVDYFPEWGNFNNFRLVADLAWEYLLDEDGNLSLKLSATDRYDSTPNGLKPNDINYAVLLLYKF